MWPASARRARLPVHSPATNSITIVPTVSMRVTISTDRERAAAVLRSWPCACIAAIVSGQRPDVRIRGMARPLGIIAAAIVGFCSVAPLLWRGPVKTAPDPPAMFPPGALSGGVGVAAMVLLAVALGRPVLAGAGVVHWWLARVER